MPMTIDQVRGLISTALADGHITHDEANDIIRATNDGVARHEKLGIVETLLETAEKRLDPNAWRALRKLLSSPASTPPPGVSAPRAGKSVLDIRTQESQQAGKREFIFVYDTGDHAELKNPRLCGTWDANGRFAPGLNGTIPMEWIGGGRYAASVELLNDSQTHPWQWGVLNDGPLGKRLLGVMGEGPVSFDPNGTEAIVRHAPTWYHHMGAHKCDNSDVRFGVYAPNARAVTVKVIGDDGATERFPMSRDPSGTWFVRIDQGWQRVEGKPYAYEIVTSDGKTVERADPYAREKQGEQRGVSRLWVNSRTGEEVSPYYIHPDLAKKLVRRYGEWKKIPLAARNRAQTTSRAELLRFEVQPFPGADRATLLIKDDAGHVLDREALLSRIGEFDPHLSPTLGTKLRGGRFDDLWSRHVATDGTIDLTQEGGAFATLMPNPEKLYGLRYEVQVFKADGHGGFVNLGDANRDGRVSDIERRATAYNDRWSDVITAESGLKPRLSIAVDTSFGWKHDTAPREADFRKWVVYQVHVGSFMGAAQNTRRSTFKDLCDRLGYLKDLGINTIELLPTGEFDGTRDWGYEGLSGLAVESSYGYADENGKWVSGSVALKRFIDEAHRRGFNVLNDVVYNHSLSGNLWEFDGPENVYFNWSKNPGARALKQTEWGPMLAMNDRKVKQLPVDHAAAQVDEYHFDGLRLDFTEPIKAAWGGGKVGWEMLREINRVVHYLNPHAFTVAEQFDYDPTLTDPADRGTSGGGFDALWYTQIQHDAVHENDSARPGIIQAVAEGRDPSMDALVSTLVTPRGLRAWSKALYIISNHDEVGNAERTIQTAAGQSSATIPDQWARDASRLAMWLGVLSPGIPFMFQGDEFMARNNFKWGTPSTWDLDWQWEKVGRGWKFDEIVTSDAAIRTYLELAAASAPSRRSDSRYCGLSAANRQVVDHLASLSPAEREPEMWRICQAQMHASCRSVIQLGLSSPAFLSDAKAEKVMASNRDGTAVIKLTGGGEGYLLAIGAKRRALRGYQINLPSGVWKEVASSDATRYGGEGVDNGGATFSGTAALDIPMGGLIVLKKVG